MKTVAAAILVGIFFISSTLGLADLANTERDASGKSMKYSAALDTQATTEDESLWVLDESKAQHDNGVTFYPVPENERNTRKITQDLAKSVGLKGGGKQSLRASKDAYDKLRRSASPATKSEEVQYDKGGALMELAAATSYWTPFYASPNGNWGPLVRRNGSLIGTSSATRWAPRWAAAPGSIISGAICGQAVGYYEGYGYKGYGVYSQFYNVGCVSGARSVPWGNVAAVPQFRATTYASLGGSGKFM